MAICREYLRNSLANPPLFAVGESGLASAAEFIGLPPFSSCRVMVAFEAARPGDTRHPVHQFVQRKLILQELACDGAPVEHNNAVGDRMHVEDIVINENGRLARPLDPGDEIRSE